MEIYIKLFEVVFPVFFVVGIGYYLGKKNPKIDTKFITNFAANIGTPAMIIYAVTSTGINFDIFRDNKEFTSLVLHKNTGLSLPKDTVFNAKYSKNLLLIEITINDHEQILTK